MEQYQKQDSRFRVFSRPNSKPKGANACRNFGWEKASGHFIKFFDSDDVMKPKFLETQINCLHQNPDLDFCVSYWELWYKDGTTMKNKPYTDIDFRTNPVKSYLLESHIFPTPSPLWRKSFLDSVEPFNEDLQRGQEADFHFNIMLKSPNYELINDFAYLVRVGHKSIKTNANSFQSQLSVFKHFANVKSKISESSNKEKKRLLQYAFFRMSIAFYNMVSSVEKNKKEEVFSTFFDELLEFAQMTHINKRVKLLMGKLAINYIGKGYRFFYYPEFDHRLKI